MYDCYLTFNLDNDSFRYHSGTFNYPELIEELSRSKTTKFDHIECKGRYHKIRIRQEKDVLYVTIKQYSHHLQLMLGKQEIRQLLNRALNK